MAEIDMDALKIRKKNVKTAITKIRTFIDQYMAKQTGNLHDVRIRAMHLENQYSLFYDTTTAIQIHEKSDTNEELDKVEDDYFVLHTRISALLEPQMSQFLQ